MPVLGIVWPIFETSLRGRWAIVVGTLYATFFPKDYVCCCLMCDSMLVCCGLVKC